MPKVSFSIDKCYNDEFFNFTVERGHCTKSAPTMSAVCWNAMSEAASLRTSHQRIVKRFLTLHFGRRMVQSEKRLAANAIGCINCMKHDFASKDGRNTTTWHRFLPELLAFELKKLDDSALHDVVAIETWQGKLHAHSYSAC